MKIGILAYGSLIEDPGAEIEPLIRERSEGVTTPFSIEFSRSSSFRDGGPTVIPVDKGGSPVSAAIIVLDDTVTIDKARDILWRRETRNEHTDRHYNPPSTITENTVLVRQLENFNGIDVVLYTKIGSNIQNLKAGALADLAIKSAKASAGAKKEDGINYLISLKHQGISTPLMPEYESAIIRKTGASSLEAAYLLCREENTQA